MTTPLLNLDNSNLPSDTESASIADGDSTNLFSFSSRRSRAFWIFLLLSVGVLAFLVYSTYLIVYDAVQGDYDWVDVDSPNTDPKIYKYMSELLPNAPPIVVVQDPGAQLTGFAIGVSAGSFYDPLDFAGLAHFTEHMLFLGTESYPGPTEFDEFMSSHGGSSNAFTDSERTVYYNSIESDSFTDAFTRFVEFFTNPLFNRTYIEKEINAVDSEHDMHLNDPNWRMFSLVSSLSLPPNNHYSTGDSGTLLNRTSDSNVTSNVSISALEEAVWTYFSANYCFNRLSIAIVSPLPVSDQIESVRNIFASIPYPPIPQNCKQAYNFTRLSPELKQSFGWPIAESSRKQIVYSQAPLETLTLVWLAFPFRPIATNNEAGKHPFSLIETVIGYNGPNSLKQVLIAQGFVLSLSFMYDDTSAGSMGYITFEVPDSSRDRIGDGIEIIFGFLYKWRKNGGISAQFVTDIQQIRSSLFYSNADSSSSANNDPMRMAKYFAAQMVTSTRNRTAGLAEAPSLLSMNEVVLEVDPVLVNELLDSMTADNVVVFVHDPHYDLAAPPDWVLGTATNLAATPQLVDPHYGFNYKVAPIKDEILTIWNTSSRAANISVFSKISVFPPDIVKTKQTLESRPNATEVMNPPSLVFQSPNVAIWYKPSVLASLPKVWLWSTIRPLATASLANANPEEVQFNGEMIVDCVTFELRSQVADFILAGYDFVINWMFSGYFEVKVFGWADRIDEFMEIIVGELSNPQMNFFTLILAEKSDSLTRNRPLSESAGEALNSLVVGSATREDITGYLNTYPPTKSVLLSWLFANFNDAFFTIYVAGSPATISSDEAVQLGKDYVATAALNATGDTGIAIKNTNDTGKTMNDTSVVTTTNGAGMIINDTGLAITSNDTGLAITTNITINETNVVMNTTTSETLAGNRLIVELPGNATLIEIASEPLNMSQWIYFLAGPKFNNSVEVRLANPAESDPNSALLYSLTFGSDMSSRDRVLLALLSSIIDPLIFRTIRTQYQMGYIASGRAGVYPGPAGAVQYRVYVQGNVASPDLMEARLEELWDSVPAVLEAIPLVEIAARAQGVAATMDESPTSAHEEVSQFWAAIHEESYCFNRANMQANFLSNTDPATLKQGIIDIFTALTVTRRSKVSVKIWKSEGVSQPAAWNATTLLGFDDTNVTNSLIAEKNGTVFLAGISKKDREFAFQQSINSTDPMWEPVIPECKI